MNDELKVPFAVHEILSFVELPDSDLWEDILRFRAKGMIDATEAFVAHAVQGEVVPDASNPGFDVWKSVLFEGHTFQVKYATRNGSGAPSWHFNRMRDDYPADWYVLFGIRDNLTWPFVFHHEYIAKHRSKRGTLSINADRWSVKRTLHKHWGYCVNTWPNGLCARCARGPHAPLPQHDLPLFSGVDVWPSEDTDFGGRTS